MTRSISDMNKELKCLNDKIRTAYDRAERERKRAEQIKGELQKDIDTLESEKVWLERDLSKAQTSQRQARTEAVNNNHDTSRKTLSVLLEQLCKL